MVVKMKTKITSFLRVSSSLNVVAVSDWLYKNWLF